MTLRRLARLPIDPVHYQDALLWFTGGTKVTAIRRRYFAQDVHSIMAPAIVSSLSIEQLRHLANDPDATATQLPAVLNSLSGNDEDQLQWACETLENCHAPGAKQLPELLPFLKHDDALVVSWTCKLLTRMQPVAEAAQAALVDLLSRHPNELVREEAARALSVQPN